MRTNRFASRTFSPLLTLCMLPLLADAREFSSIDEAHEVTQLYFSSGSSFQTGDLITRSQIAEFQAYLRKTRTRSPLVNPILIKLAVADDAPLPQMFFSEEGTELFRAAAKELGGYASLERTLLNDQGRLAVIAAIEAQSVDAVQQAVEQFAPKKDAKSNTRHLYKDRIYTVADLLDRAFSASE